MSLLNHLYKQIEAVFKKHPHRFFTEHDIHSELAQITTELLKNEGRLYVESPKDILSSVCLGCGKVIAETKEIE